MMTASKANGEGTEMEGATKNTFEGAHGHKPHACVPGASATSEQAVSREEDGPPFIRKHLL